MKSHSTVPCLSELIAAGVGAIELICQVPTCKRAQIMNADVFSPNETVLTIARKARCSVCGRQQAEVYPVWNRTDHFGSAMAVG